jgi:hypothetical protein
VYHCHARSLAHRHTREKKTGERAPQIILP